MWWPTISLYPLPQHISQLLLLSAVPITGSLPMELNYQVTFKLILHLPETPFLYPLATCQTLFSPILASPTAPDQSSHLVLNFINNMKDSRYRFYLVTDFHCCLIAFEGHFVNSKAFYLWQCDTLNLGLYPSPITQMDKSHKLTETQSPYLYMEAKMQSHLSTRGLQNSSNPLLIAF